MAFMLENPYQSPNETGDVKRSPSLGRAVLALIARAALGALIGSAVGGGLSLVAVSVWRWLNPAVSAGDVFDVLAAGAGFGTVLGWTVAILVGLWRSRVKKSPGERG
jgi:hypothetical protein